MSIDLESLKARLAEYDPNAPKCPQRVSRHSNYAPDHVSSSDSTYHDYDMATHSPCCRPEGHEGECRNSRSVMGWPGFATVSALLTEIERLRGEVDHEKGTRIAAYAYASGAVDGQDTERAAVVAWLRGSDDDMILDTADDIEGGEHYSERKPW